MGITIGSRYDPKTKKLYFVAKSDEGNLVGSGDNAEAALLQLEEQIREEYHPERTPLRLREKEAAFLAQHERDDS